MRSIPKSWCIRQNRQLRSFVNGTESGVERESPRVPFREAVPDRSPAPCNQQTEWRAMSDLRRTGGRMRQGSAAALFLVALGGATGRTQEPAEKPSADSVTQVLTRDAAVWRALQSNPELATLRQQR